MSIPDLVPEVPTSVEVGELPALTFTIVPGASHKSKPCLVSSHNHTYNFKKTLKRTGATVWQCSVRNKNIYCTAMVTQLGDIYTPGSVIGGVKNRWRSIPEPLSS